MTGNSYILTDLQRDLIVQELIECNRADEFYLHSPDIDVDDEERDEIEVNVQERNDIIVILCKIG